MMCVGGWQLHQYINKLRSGVIAPTGESDCLASSRLWVRVPLAPPYADVAQSGERSPQEGTGRRFESVHWQKQLPMV